jgi:signal transduction histidine kinase
MEILSRISQQINSVLETPVVMRTLVTSAMDLIEGSAGMYGLVQHGRMVFHEYNDNGQWCPTDLVCEKGYGVPGWVMTTLKPYVCQDAKRDPHVIPDFQKRWKFYNFVNVPILNAKGELLGCLEILNKREKRPFSDEDLLLLQGLAASAAIALENSQMLVHRARAEEELQESEQQLRQLLEDRERIARDLHDNIIQTIYAIGMGLEECQRLIKKDPGLASKAAGGAVESLNAVIRDVRKYIAGLEPQILSGRQLRAELAKLVRTMEVPHLLRFHVSVDPTAAARLTPEEANHVLCVVREAMSNSLRHSHAKSGNISLQLLNGDVRLEVADDGVGFDAHETHKNGEHGDGLRNMEARAQELGARLEVISRRRQGTRVILDIPLERKNV